MPTTQKLVRTWLSAIGLPPSIVDTFEAAGIVHPRDLAELEVCHYPALGVKEAADRKKLFYLIQRVKMAVPSDGDGDGKVHVDGNGDGEGGTGGGGLVEGVAVSPSSESQHAGEGTDGQTPSSSFDANNGSNTANAKKNVTAAAAVSASHRRTRSNASSNASKGGNVSAYDEQDDDEDDNDGYLDSFDKDNEDELDDDEDDGIDAVLEEQYKPLLAHSDEDDEGLLDQSYEAGHGGNGDDDEEEEYTSDEEVPSPPPSNSSTPISTSNQFNHNLNNSHNLNDSEISFSDATATSPTSLGTGVSNVTDFSTNMNMHMNMGLEPDSPIRHKKEEEFLKRRNARLKGITPPRKTPPRDTTRSTRASARGGRGAGKVAQGGTVGAAKKRNAKKEYKPMPKHTSGHTSTAPSAGGTAAGSKKSGRMGKLSGMFKNRALSNERGRSKSNSRNTSAARGATGNGKSAVIKAKRKSPSKSPGKKRHGSRIEANAKELTKNSPSNAARRQIMAKMQKKKELESPSRRERMRNRRNRNRRGLDMEPINPMPLDVDAGLETEEEDTNSDMDLVAGVDLDVDFDDDLEVEVTAPPTATRVSKRLQEKKLQELLSSGNNNKYLSGDNASVSSRNSRRSTSSNKSAGTGKGRTSSSSRRRTMSDSSDVQASSSIPRGKGGGGSGNGNGGNNRRVTMYASSNSNNGSRIQTMGDNAISKKNKRLSTIPSGIAAPMSPLINLHKMNIDSEDDMGIHIDHEDHDAEADAASLSSARSAMSARSNRSTTSRKSIVSMGNIYTNSTKPKTRSHRLLSGADKKGKSNMSDLGRAKSTPRGRTSIVGGSGSAYQQHEVSSIQQQQIKSTSDIDLVKSKSLDEREKERERNNNKPGNSNITKPAATTGTSGAVFVHGGKPDKSWGAQVKQLRDANMLKHDQEMGGNGNEIENISDEEMRIRVIVRTRPMSKKEATKKGEVTVIHPLRYSDYGRVLVYQPKTRVDLTKEVETLPFAFDNVFPEISNNCQIYNETIKPLIPGTFEGRWASVFAYGQTGSGKTFTMMGSTLTGIKAKTRNVEHEKNYGLYLLAARDLFEFAERPEYSHLSVGASLFEIYGGKLFDLLNERAPVKCLENHKGKVCFPGLSEHPISDAVELMRLIETGSANRSTGSTSANRDSSRSHAVLQLHLRKSVGKRSNVEHGRLTFIDLAGSERGADTNKASRTTRQEGADINVSLLALKEVIRALATGDSMTHIPFRGSKLTQVLKEGFVGKNSRTVMVACIAPNMTNCEHTLNTLRYADRVKERNSENGQLAASVAAASRIQTKSLPSPRPITAPPASFDVDRSNSQASLAGGNVYTDDLLLGDDDDDDDDELDDDNWLSDLDKEDDDDNEVLAFDPFTDDDVGMDELNEVLKSPVATNLGRSAFFKEKKQKKSSPISAPMATKITKKRVSASAAASAFKSKKEAVAPLVNDHRSIMTEMLSMVKQEMTLVNCTDADRELIDEYLDELEEIQDKQLSMISTLRESLVQYYARRPNGQKNDVSNGDNSLHADESFDDLRSPYSRG